MAAHVLTLAGAKVVMLEAGPKYNRGRRATCSSGTTIRPTAPPAPGSPSATTTRWWAAGTFRRALHRRPGVEVHVVSRAHARRPYQSLGPHLVRMGPTIQAVSRDGKGVDWPIAYDDWRPTTTSRGIGRRFRQRRAWRTSRTATSKPPPSRVPREDRQEGLRRARILHSLAPRHPHQAAQRPRPPATTAPSAAAAARSTPTSRRRVLLTPALATGRLRSHRCDGPRGDDRRRRAATGVSYIEHRTGSERARCARVVVLAASACETARILLNSKPSIPNGLANSSGPRPVHHGHRGHQRPAIPQLDGRPRATMKTAPAACTCTCRGGSTTGRWTSRAATTSSSAAAAVCRAGIFGGSTLLGGGYGKDFKRDPPEIRRERGFAGRGEMIPNQDSYCEIDPDMVDQWGIPVLRFHFKWTDDETTRPSTCRRPSRKSSAAGGKDLGHDAGRLHGRHRARRRDHPRGGGH